MPAPGSASLLRPWTWPAAAWAGTAWLLLPLAAAAVLILLVEGFDFDPGDHGPAYYAEEVGRRTVATTVAAAFALGAALAAVPAVVRSRASIGPLVAGGTAFPLAVLMLGVALAAGLQSVEHARQWSMLPPG